MPDYLYEHCLGVNTKAVLKKYCGDYYRVVGTQSSVAKSIKKMDAPRCVEFKTHPLWSQAKQYVRDEYHALFQRVTRVRKAEEILPLLSLDTAAGQPWQALGLKKKRDCLKSDGFLNYLYANPEDHRPPVWKISPKTEWYPLQKLEDDKVRTFIVPPFHLLYYQKALYETQNQALKEFGWSAYGFNPYQGGVDRLARRLLVNSVFMCYDVVGWDRVLPCLPTVYNQRNNYFDDVAYKLALWVTKHTVHSHLMQPDGKIFKKKIGNNSGSGNTTADNILAHAYILCLTLLDLYDGDERKVKLAVAALFGDDNIMSLPSVPPGKDLESVFTRVYGLFGLKFDPFQISSTLEGLEFLGFQFVKLKDGWIPRYKQERLVASFCYTIEKRENLGASIARAWTLAVMSAGGDRVVFDTMCDALRVYMVYLQDHPDPTVRAFVELGVPDYDSCINFYLGRESGFPLHVETSIGRLVAEINRYE